MSKQARKNLALFSAAVLLIVHAVPAFAICVCDVPGEMPCCATNPSEPVAEEDYGCCSTEPRGPMEMVSCFLHGPPGTDSDFRSISAPVCEKRVVSSALSSVIVPGSTETTRKDLAPTLVTLAAGQIHAPAEERASRGYLQGPPGRVSSPPNFLLNASFLI